MVLMYILVFIFTVAILQQSVVQGTRRKPQQVDVGQPLLLTPLLENGNISEAQQQSRVRPDIANTESYSGYFTVNKACESNLFFWYFPAQKNSQTAPVVLFLQGGPGASSIYSLFVEVGPLTFRNRRDVGNRQYSWNVENNLLFIDQPVGTGYSFTGKGCYAKNETVVGEELYSAMVQFYQLFPHLVRNKFVITGYSYAGHFIPALGHTIHKYNPSAKVKINLTGMMIGDGWMDGYYQNDLASLLYQLGLLDDEGRDVYIEQQNLYSEHIRKQEYEAAMKIRGDLVDSLYVKYVGNVSNFNYLNDSVLIPEPYEGFIQTPQIRKAIHVGNTNFTFYNLVVESNMGVDPVLSVKPWVEELLEHYFIVFYTGQLDIICGYPMTVSFLKALEWSGKDVYRSAKRQKWCVNDQQAGYFKKANNLYEVLVRNAGHQVPYDQPLWAYVLVNTVAGGTKDNPVQGLTVCKQ